ncbi:MAG: nitronate monooxygenase [Aureispira sp.]|nr:nitronate monooxygenase [Aureispira sp.]
MHPAKKFTSDIGIQTPVICGPMYPGSNPELIAAVSEAGGLGVVQPVAMTYVYGHDFRKGLQLIKNLTKKPFGVNFTLVKGNKTYQKRLRKWLDISLEENVPFFLTSLGNPDWIVKKAHAQNIKVYHDTPSRKFALKVVDVGVDGLIAVNNRAGGQTGFISPEQLFEDLQDLGLPVVCAGGVGNTEDFKKMLQLGYAAVQMGTRFLATQECQIQNNYKQAIVEAREKDIIWTNKIAGVNSSVIKTPDIEKLGLQTGPLMSYLLRQRRTKNLVRSMFMLKSMIRFKKVANKSSYVQYWQAGKGVSHIDKIEPVSRVLKGFHHSYEQFLAT